MAEIKFIGFVEDWTKNNPDHPAWGMRVSEPHRRQNNNTWETYGRTYRTIKAAYGIDIDFTRFVPGDRVEVIGREITESSERDGKKYDNLIVKAESVKKVEQFARNPSPVDAIGSLDAIGAVPLEDAPF